MTISERDKRRAKSEAFRQSRVEYNSALFTWIRAVRNDDANTGNPDGTVRRWGHGTGNAAPLSAVRIFVSENTFDKNTAEKSHER